MSDLTGHRIPLGAGEGGGGSSEKTVRIRFYPRLVECPVASPCLVGHKSTERFSYPVPGMTAVRPGAPEESDTRLTCGPCKTYAPVVENKAPSFSGGTVSYAVAYHVWNRTPEGWKESYTVVYESDLREVEIDEETFDPSTGSYKTTDVVDDDVYFLLVGYGVSKRSTRKYHIPEGWAGLRRTVRDGSDDPDSYADKFSVFKVTTCEGASFPTPLPDGCTEDRIVGLVDGTFNDLNGFSSHMFSEHVRFCMRGDYGTIVERAISVGPLYPDDNPYNFSGVGDYSLTGYTRPFFLLYTVKNEDDEVEGAMATVEFLSHPIRQSETVKDPGGFEHELSFVTGVTNLGWFYRRDPTESKDSSGKFPTPASPLDMPEDFKVELVGTSDVSWNVVETYDSENIDREDADYTDISNLSDAKVPDRRYDISAYDGHSVVEHDDAPESN